MHDEGHYICIISNQAGVAANYLTKDTLKAKLDKVFENDKWIEKIKQKLESFISESVESNINNHAEYCLSVVVACLDKKNVSIFI